MRAVLQRVTSADVRVDGTLVGSIGPGILVLLGVGQDDEEDDALRLARKTSELRIFADEAGRMNRSLLDIGGGALVVSQFTLYGDVRKGRRPSFVKAASPEKAAVLYERFCEALRERGIPVETGRFQAMMAVRLTNDGPVTILLDSEELKRR